MSFLCTVTRAKDYLEAQGRVSLRVLSREFGLDGEALNELIEELVAVLGVAKREGDVLSWLGGAATRAPLDRSRSSAPPDAERRHLTVMFVDLVGSTSLSERVDPEDFAAILEHYQEACRVALASWGGFVARPLGDGLVIYFGFPKAQEDAASRAIRAALEITQAMPALTEALRSRYPVLDDHALQVRVGVHTGLAVVGDIASAGTPEQVAVGDTPNLAARLQGAAGPGEVLISAATLRLVPGMFQCEDRGTRALKGISEPVRMHRVIRATGMDSRLPLDPSRLTPLVGREREAAFLADRWERAKEGQGQVVLVAGEAGIGKSRLVHLLRERLANEAFSWLEGHASPYHQGRAFYPLVELIERGAGLRHEDDPESKLARLDELFAAPTKESVVPSLAALLSIPLPDGFSPASGNPALQRARMMEALVAWICRLAIQRPLILLVEDLHWCDPSTVELLGRLTDACAAARLLVLLSFRPDFDPAWPARSHIARLDVARLRRRGAEELVAHLTRGRELPPSVAARILDRAGGVPIFVEELTKMVLETGGDLLRELEIPETLQDSLMARLDRLGGAKDVAQLGATLGREFSFELLAAVSPLASQALEECLDALVEAEFLYRRDLNGVSRFQFKHALVQEMAYQSLLKSKRQAHHTKVAAALESEFPELCENEPQLLAHHHQESGPGGRERAVAYWGRAGQQAVARSANAEAIGHLEAGLRLLRALPESAETLRAEFQFQLPLGTAFLVSRGYRAPEVGVAYGRAQTICEQLGDTPDLVAALFGQWRHTMAPPDFETGLRLGKQLIALASLEDDAASRVLAHYALGSVFHLLGDVVQTREQMALGIHHYGRVAPGSLLMQAGIDPGVTCRSVLSHALWELGLPDQAHAERGEALALAEGLGHPPSEAFAVVWTGAKLAMFHDDAIDTRRWAERAIALCEEHGIALFLAMAHVLRGWARSKQGDVVAGGAEIEAGLDALREQGTELFRTTWLALRAQAQADAGDLDGGLETLSSAFALVERNDERFWEAELYRVRGDLLCQAASAGAPNAKLVLQAEEAFSTSIQISQRRATLGWELRATTHYAALLCGRGERDRAREALVAVCSRFAEGFNSADFLAAKSLLADL